MARYDYRCPKCNTTFEVEHPMSEHPLVTCPNCGTEAQRVFSASGISLQGSGFYSTDTARQLATIAAHLGRRHAPPPLFVARGGRQACAWDGSLTHVPFRKGRFPRFDTGRAYLFSVPYTRLTLKRSFSAFRYGTCVKRSGKSASFPQEDAPPRAKSSRRRPNGLQRRPFAWPAYPLRTNLAQKCPSPRPRAGAVSMQPSGVWLFATKDASWEEAAQAGASTTGDRT